MATAVQIELTVDEKGAVQGVRTFDAAVKGTAATTSNLDATLKQLNATLERTAVSGAGAGHSAGRGMRQIKEEGLSTKEGIHLVTEEFGVQMPRAFKNLIAQSSIATSAVKAVGSGIVALGAIQIGVMVFEQLYEGAHKLWEEHLSLTKAAEDYEKELVKIKEQDFGNTRSIATTQLRIQEATKSIEEFRRQSEAVEKHPMGATAWMMNAVIPGSGGLAQWLADRSAAHDLQDKQFAAQREKDKLEKENLVEQGHQQRVGQIELNHAKDDQLTKEQQILAVQQKQVETLQEEARHSYEVETARGNNAVRNPVATTLFNTGKLTPEALKELAAADEAAAQKHNLDKERHQQLRKLQEDALEANLRGEAVYRAQEAFAIEELKNEEMGSAAAINAVKSKFHGEQMKRIQAEELELRKMHEQTELASLTGIPRIQQEGRNKINDLRAENAQTGKLNPGQLLKAEKEIGDQTDAAIVQAQKTYSDQVDSILEQSAERTLSGFARIHAEAQKQIRDLESDFRDKGGKPEDLARGKAGIHADEDKQVADLQRRNADETAQIEAQARAHSLSAEKQQTAAIQAEYDERLRQYIEEKTQEGLSDDNFNRRVAAAAQERDAQLVEAAKAAREKMAGEFTRFFKDPLGSMKEMGEKMAGEAAAAMVQRVQGRLGVGATTSEGHHGLPGLPGFGESFGGLFGRIAGKKNPDVDRIAEVGKAAGTPQTGLISLASAQIRIGSAMISGGGFMSGAMNGSTTGGAFSAPGGSTAEFGGFGGGGSTGGGSFGGGGFSGDGSSGAPSAIGAGLAGVDKGIGLFSQAKSIFKPGSPASKFGESGGTQDLGAGDLGGMPDLSGIFGANKTKVVGPTNNGMLGGGGFLSNATGAAGGAMGLFSAYQGNGGFGGAAGGAMSGMEFGMAVGGPIGAAVGAVGGAILGAIGFGGREKGRVYDLKTVRPRIGADTTAFQQGSMDYLSAYSDLQALDQEARKTLDKMGGSARSYYWDTINGEIKQAEAKLTREEKAGRSQVIASAAQYDIGADSIPRDGWGILHKRERIIPGPQNERITRAIERGTSMAGIHQSYLNSMSTRDARQTSSIVHNHEYNVKAWDSKSVTQMLMDNKHMIRAAHNASYAENSGGADA